MAPAVLPSTELKPAFTLDVLTESSLGEAAGSFSTPATSVAALLDVLAQQSLDPADSIPQQSSAKIPQALTQLPQDVVGPSTGHVDLAVDPSTLADSLTVVPTTLTSLVTSSSSGLQVVVATTQVSSVTVEKATGVVSATFVPTVITQSITTTISNSVVVLTTQVTSSIAAVQVNGQLISQAVVPTTVTNLLTKTSSGIEIVVPTEVVSPTTVRMANGQLISETVVPTTVTSFVVTTNVAGSTVTMPTTIVSSVTVVRASAQEKVQLSNGGIAAPSVSLQGIVGGAASLASGQHPNAIDPALNGVVFLSDADALASGHLAGTNEVRPAITPLVAASMFSSGHPIIQDGDVVSKGQHGSSVTAKAGSAIGTHGIIQAAVPSSTGLGNYIVAGIQPGVQPDISQASAALPTDNGVATQTTPNALLSMIPAALLVSYLIAPGLQVMR